MIDQDSLANGFAINLNIIQRQTEGLTHEDSLLQPPFRGNCLNWVLGHITLNRNRVLEALGEELVLDETEAARYETGSKPITEDGPDVIALDELLKALEVAQERVAAGLQRTTAEDLTQEMEAGQQTTTLGERLFGLYFHETYHTGQTELLRQLAGTDDQVI